MVADTGKWLPGRKELISATSLGAVDWSIRLFQVQLTQRQIGKARANGPMPSWYRSFLEAECQ
jgi:hypothetical protein